MGKQRPILSAEQTARLAETFGLLGDPNRLRIVLTCLDQPVSVGEIASRLELSASLVSHHLRLLRSARLLRADRHGKQVFYTGDDAHVVGMLDDMVHHVSETSG